MMDALFLSLCGYILCTSNVYNKNKEMEYSLSQLLEDGQCIVTCYGISEGEYDFYNDYKYSFRGYDELSTYYIQPNCDYLIKVSTDHNKAEIRIYPDPHADYGTSASTFSRADNMAGIMILTAALAACAIILFA